MTGTLGISPETLHARLYQKNILAPLSPAAAELLRIVSKPEKEIEVRELAKHVSVDPMLTAKVLRMANSPYYATLKRIETVRHAIMVIGLVEAGDFLTFQLMKGRLAASTTFQHFASDDFWLHCYAVGTVARSLGNPTYLVQTLPSELYLAGLLHDIGKMVMAVQIPGEFQACLKRAHSAQIPLFQAERQLLGIDHARVGADILTQWKMSPRVARSVGFHHFPDKADEEICEICQLVEFANLLVNIHGPGQSGSPAGHDLSQSSVMRNDMRPLASEETQQSIYKRIIEPLVERSEIVLEKEAEEGEESPQEPQPQAAPKPSSHVPAQRQPSLWNRCVSRVRSAIGL
ncbi:HDOD domain-containing protein [Candidatus Sumerlaeota bacterium]|nr:HDOD domain-containing protein [Candidatus Sumerlaeota bacterium]